MANRFPLVFDAAGDKQIKELPTGDNLNLLGSSIVDVVNMNASGTIVADTLTVNTINASGGSIAAVAISNNYADLDNKPTLFSGDYNDLDNLPVAGGNTWADITNKPVIPSALSLVERSNSNIKISPNPTNGYCLIDMGETYRKVSVIVSDLSGKVIQSNTYNESQVLNLNLNEPAGVYFLMVEAGNEETLIRLIKE